MPHDNSRQGEMDATICEVFAIDSLEQLSLFRAIVIAARLLKHLAGIAAVNRVAFAPLRTDKDGKPDATAGVVVTLDTTVQSSKGERRPVQIVSFMDASAFQSAVAVPLKNLKFPIDEMVAQLGGFGMHGAFLSGKIAARAYSDPAGAYDEFRRLNWTFYPLLAAKRIINRSPQELLVKYPMRAAMPLALLLNRKLPAKGLITTLLMLPMMMSAAVVGLFWRLLYDPSWGPLNYVLGLGNLAWLSDANLALYALSLIHI